MDTALFKTGQMYGFGLVARDDHGYIIKGYTRCLQGTVELKLAEAMRAREGLSWIKEHSWQQVVLDTYCLVVQAL